MLPPIAKKIPKRMVEHGNIRVDDYFWMKRRENPEVLKYVRAENKYADSVMKRTERLQNKLFREYRSRLTETDVSVPTRIDDYYYYKRMLKGKQYPVYCRKHGSLGASEEVILDGNAIAGRNKFFDMLVHKVSPDHRYVAYLTDREGSERYSLHVKDLQTGKLVGKSIPSTAMVVWANDSRTIFYSTKNKVFRASRVYRHVLGTDSRKDKLVFQEKDEMCYYLHLEKTKSKKYITITTESATTSEVSYLDADRPEQDFKILYPRKHNHEYYLFHHGNNFIIMTNERAPNFKLVQVPVSDPSKKRWKELLPHREEVAIDVSHPLPWVEVFRDYMAVFERSNAYGRIRVMSFKDDSSHFIELPEDLCFVTPGDNPEYGSSVFRFNYSAMVTPPTVYDYDVATRTLVMRKQDKVKGLDPSKYKTERIHAKAKDGTLVPISLVYKKGLRKNGRNPGYLYAYGAYGDYEGAAPRFNPYWLSMLDRGFVCANAHIRGGGDLGKKWHEQGRMLGKINTFTDFIACAEHLIRQKYTSADRLAIRGASAGGLLMGAVTMMRPDLFKAVVAEVPFVDVITTMFDDSIPLTVPEFEEWGNPKIRSYYQYFRRYSPYDRVERREYPNMLMTAGWNDSRVQYWEPTKWVAKLRATKTDDNVLVLRTNMVEGHAGASGRYDTLREYAFKYAFIMEILGIRS